MTHQSLRPGDPGFGQQDRFKPEFIEQETAAIIRACPKPLAWIKREVEEGNLLPRVNFVEEAMLEHIKQTHRGTMDKQINKVKRDVEKGEKGKAEKDIGKLLKMDKKADAKLEKCDKGMKKK